MIETILGIIQILVNGKEIDYIQKRLDRKGKNYAVDERFKITVEIPKMENETIIECRLIKKKLKPLEQGVESGEKLALISFYHDNEKVSIGTEDEIPNVIYSYTSQGLKVVVTEKAKISRIIFGVAWIAMQDREKEDVYTWFAADPTLFDR